MITVILEDALLGPQSFEIEHAQRILKFEAELGVQHWVLTDENYQLEDGKIIGRALPGNTDNTRKQPEPNKG